MLRGFLRLATRGMRGSLWSAGVAALLSCTGDLGNAPDRAPGRGHLVAPGNDDFANATVITALPFMQELDITDATAEAGEPTPSCFPGSPGRSVWYSFTPGSTGWVAVSTPNMGGAYVGSYTGSGLAGLTEFDCRPFFGGRLAFVAQGGTTYYFQVEGSFGALATLRFQLEGIPVPTNDDFANASRIATLPFSTIVDNTSASVAGDEPIPSCAGPRSKTVWYSFKSKANQSVSALTVNTGFPTVITAYSGSSPAGLTELGCRSGFGGRVTFRAVKGTTYYLQVDDVNGQGGPLELHLDVADPPTVNLGFSPSDPSVFDVIQFFDLSVDPGDAGFASREWRFGDGTRGTDCCPTHQFAKDKDYTVKLTVTTVDGRTGSTSQTVSVRTHDVAITRLAAPKSAVAGQTQAITIGLKNRRYLETVEIQLFRSLPAGFELVGSSTLTVPVRAGSGTTETQINYTFTTADAAIGKVTFKAVAILVGTRDALIADNEAISPPTRVKQR